MELDPYPPIPLVSSHSLWMDFSGERQMEASNGTVIFSFFYQKEKSIGDLQKTK
jgi:hypothetical protein